MPSKPEKEKNYCGNNNKFPVSLDLICPRCRLSLDFAIDKYNCRRCQNSYPLLAGIPSLLSENARKNPVQAHYDKTPFDYLNVREIIGQAKKEYLRTVYPELFLRTASALGKNEKVLDVGAGWGRDALYLKSLGIQPLCVDISLNSLRYLRSLGLACLHASNLELPLADSCTDMIFSDGVIHHTPQPHQAFAELARILRPSGKIYLAVYQRNGHYPFLYRFVGGPLRSMKNMLGGSFLVDYVVVGLYYLATALLKPRRRRNWRRIKNLFYDYFMTPIAHFYSREELAVWFTALNLKEIEYQPYKNVHQFLIQKEAASYISCAI